jgi:error-prone DNA polymerase
MPELPDPKFRPTVEVRAPHVPSAAYAELQVTSNFSFLRGGSHPEELVAAAASSGCRAVALTDLNTLAGIVRAHEAAREAGIQLIVGCHVAIGNDQAAAPQSDKENGNPSNSPPPNPPPLFPSAPLSILLYPTTRAAYGRLCRLLTRGKRRAAKGHCDLMLEDVLEYQPEMLAILLPPPPQLITENFLQTARLLRDTFDDDRFSLAVHCLYDGHDHSRLASLANLARQLRTPLVATNEVHYHIPGRRPLQDVLTCIRLGCTLDQAGFALFANAERHIKGPDEMARLFRHHPAAIRRTLEIAERARPFSLNQLKYQYPSEVCPPGKSMMDHLVDRTWEGARERYRDLAKAGAGNDEIRMTNDESNPNGRMTNDQNGGSAHCFDSSNSGHPSDPDHPSNAHIPPTIKSRLAHEFDLIRELNYPAYFLTVDDIVAFARSRGILCQGRGAAANSAVCYCLGITSVDPARIDLLVERFISKERNEPPDIDIDFEHERREEVIQYLYNKYGRDRAALTAEVITYRRRSAVREVGKALGLSLDCVDKLAKSGDWWDSAVMPEDRLRELGLNPHDPVLRDTIRLAGELIGFPRHLSQHVGGFVISQDPLCEIVPVENAAMPDRTIIEWDKDDIDAMGMLKVDVLGLGMLTCIRKAIDFVNDEIRMTNDESNSNERMTNDQNRRRMTDRFEHSDIRHSDLIRHSNFEFRHFPPPSSAPPLKFHTIPPEDPAVYDMLCKADSIGVFQVESRAQMTMLPRLKPRCFYDLVIEVAIVRPGPIQGDMVHPYLRRRNGEEQISYPNDRIKAVLARTLGVPLFQEQAMRLVMVAAGFSAGEADQLRRAMAAWKRKGALIEKFADKIVSGMLANGYTHPYALRVVQQIKGFSDYGFPESHAASFALLVYVSSWLKCHHPAAFAAALINSQPMGFYQPAQIIRDARDHGVRVLPIDVNHSDWDCTLEHKENDEARMTNDESNSNDECSNVQNDPSSSSCFGHSSFGHSDLIRHSSFEFRHSPPLLRLGMRLITGMRQADADLIAAAIHNHGPFSSIPSLWRASGVRVAALRQLAAADAFTSMGLDRQHALWQVMQLRDDHLPLLENLGEENEENDEARMTNDESNLNDECSNVQNAAHSPRFGHSSFVHSNLIRHSSFEFRHSPILPPIPLPTRVIHDYAATGLSLKAHPLSFAREALDRQRITPAGHLADERRFPHGTRVAVAGLVLVRQRPGTASGVVFITLEDETGTANLIVRPAIYERYRPALRHSIALVAHGTVERQGQVIHILIRSAQPLRNQRPAAPPAHPAATSPPALPSMSRDFH